MSHPTDNTSTDNGRPAASQKRFRKTISLYTGIAIMLLIGVIYIGIQWMPASNEFVAQHEDLAKDEAIIYLADFNTCQINSSPEKWKDITEMVDIGPSIQEISGTENKALLFPELRDTYENKDFILSELALAPPYTVTVKLNFIHTNADKAGLIIARTESGIIRIQPNAYWGNIEIWEYYEANVNTISLSNVVEGTPPTDLGHEQKLTSITQEISPMIEGNRLSIEANRDYWLRAVAREDEQKGARIEIYWSNDGVSFSNVMSISGVSSLQGTVGLTTSGPNLPPVYFDDFEIEYWGDEIAPACGS